MHPKPEGVLESSLYVTDVTASSRFTRRCLGFASSAILKSAVAQCKLAIARSCCYSKRAVHARFSHRMTAVASCMSPSLSLLRSWQGESWLAETAIAVEEKHTWELGLTTGRRAVSSPESSWPDMEAIAKAGLKRLGAISQTCTSVQIHLADFMFY
jgi:hypothetical protein